MKELYFISVLGNLSIAASIILIVGLILYILLVGVYVVNYDCDEDVCNAVKKTFKWSIIPMVLSLLLAIFIPDKKDMYVIYGVGTVIDYCQDNPEVKHIPDKTITLINKTLDKYLDNEEEKE